MDKEKIILKNTTKSLRVYEDINNNIYYWSYNSLIMIYNKYDKYILLNKDCYRYSNTTIKHTSKVLNKLKLFYYQELKEAVKKALKNNKKQFILNDIKIKLLNDNSIIQEYWEL